MTSKRKLFNDAGLGTVLSGSSSQRGDAGRVLVSRRASSPRVSYVRIPAALLLASLCLAGSAAAQEMGGSDQGVSLSLGVDPSLPQLQALPGGVLPRLGEPPGENFRFDFHGILIAPLSMGINERNVEPRPGQSKTVLHAPPITPDDLETFSHTGVVPATYAQLNFSYGNSLVVGTATIVAREATVSTGFFDPPSQRGVNDLFLSIFPTLPLLGRTTIYVGAFSNRYGVAGEYDEGRYGTPLIARTNGMGENIIARVPITEDISLMLEHGFQGQTNKAGNGIIPAGWNDFADPGVGSSFVHHGHLGATYRNTVSLGGHYMLAWAQDDRATGAGAPDGEIQIAGADLRLNLGRFGHLYGAYSNVKATTARVVGRIVEVLNTRGGPGLMQNYLGAQSGGTGSLNILGWQYDLSIGRLVSYPVPFSGDGPDIFFSVFGIYAGVKSNDVNFDGTSKIKFGAEGTYSLLPWLAVSMRYDNVRPGAPASTGGLAAINANPPFDTAPASDDDFAFQVFSPRIILRSDWQARDQVVLQWSHWENGILTAARQGYPAVEDLSVFPDKDVISLSANMWW
jgi:hypothetical protein